MEFLTKEKSSKKENCVNNQNNSVELFPVTNTWVTLSYLNYFSIKKTQLVALKKGSSLVRFAQMLVYLDKFAPQYAATAHTQKHCLKNTFPGELKSIKKRPFF
jgi:hypothetical protein